jgi:hypothetical protein
MIGLGTYLYETMVIVGWNSVYNNFVELSIDGGGISSIGAS